MAVLRHHKDQSFRRLSSHWTIGTIVNRCQTHTRCECSTELENRSRLCLHRCARLLHWQPESRQRRCYRQSEFLVEFACYSETPRSVSVSVSVSAWVPDHLMAAKSGRRSSKRLANCKGKLKATRRSDRLRSHLRAFECEASGSPWTERISRGRGYRPLSRYPATPNLEFHRSYTLQG